MSWDETRYKATCATCGRTGVCIKGSDDWNRSRTLWEGFIAVPPDPTAVAMKRVDARDMSARCECGSSNVTVGEVLR